VMRAIAALPPRIDDREGDLYLGIVQNPAVARDTECVTVWIIPQR
jgi:hypothetical protein